MKGVSKIHTFFLLNCSMQETFTTATIWPICGCGCCAVDLFSLVGGFCLSFVSRLVLWRVPVPEKLLLLSAAGRASQSSTEAESPSATHLTSSTSASSASPKTISVICFRRAGFGLNVRLDVNQTLLLQRERGAARRGAARHFVSFDVGRHDQR